MNAEQDAQAGAEPSLSAELLRRLTVGEQVQAVTIEATVIRRMGQPDETREELGVIAEWRRDDEQTVPSD